jgi:hypothetical protein
VVSQYLTLTFQQPTFAIAKESKDVIEMHVNLISEEAAD